MVGDFFSKFNFTGVLLAGEMSDEGRRKDSERPYNAVIRPTPFHVGLNFSYFLNCSFIPCGFSRGRSPFISGGGWGKFIAAFLICCFRNGIALSK